MSYYSLISLMPKTTIDPDANAVITAIEGTGVTLTTIRKNACITLITDLKGYGIWTKIKALYGILGGTAAAHKFNWKDPRDLDVAFRLNYSSGWTHSANGMTPLNAYANTFLVPSSNLTLNSTHVSYYSRTNVLTDMIEMGSYDGNGTIYQGRFSGKEWYLVNNSSGSSVQYTDANTLGLYIANRTASNVLNGWKNGTKVATGAVNSTGLNNYAIYLGGWNQLGTSYYPSSKQCAFASIGNGLTDTEAANFYTAVQAYQTTLGRQV